MAVEIRMPELSAQMTEADLIAWLVKPGDRVEAGDVIAEIETDKSTVELEAEASGTVKELRVAEGTTGVKVGEVLALLEAGDGAAQEAAAPEAAEETVDLSRAGAGAEADAGKERDAPAPTTRSQEAGSEAEPEAGGHEAPAAETREPRDDDDEGPAATALARRIAAQGGVDLSRLRGSGAAGRIVKADVERALRDAGAGEAPAEEERPAAAREGEAREAEEVPAGLEDVAHVPHRVVRASRMRRTIARRLAHAKRTVPHFYLSAECPVDRLLEVRRELNDGEDGARISVNDFAVRALALALREVPEANVAWSDDGLVEFLQVDVSVAVATEGGLVTPVVQRADRKGLRTISDEVRELAGRAREGRLRPEEYRGGTFSISNLGMYGVDSVYPILNPPQAGILGLGAATQRPVARDGELAVATAMTLTLAADHRAVDGAVGAQLLTAVRRRLEDPLEMLL